MKPSSRGALAFTSFIVILVLRSPLLAEPIPLKRIVELALSHATAGAIAAADEQRADAAYQELRKGYIPQLTAGAGLGPPSYGFTLALEGQAPALFTINTQSSIYNFSLRSATQAAKVDEKVAALNTKDQREAIIQDAAQSYAELSKWEQRLARLQETQTEADKFQAAVEQRVKEGVDSEVDGTKAKLSAARVRLRVAEAQGSADVLREHLAKLTGLAAQSIRTDPDSFPATPAPPSEETVKDAAASAPSVE